MLIDDDVVMTTSRDDVHLWGDVSSRVDRLVRMIEGRSFGRVPVEYPTNSTAQSSLVGGRLQNRLVSDLDSDGRSRPPEPRLIVAGWSAPWLAQW